MEHNEAVEVVVIVSADAEWRAVVERFEDIEIGRTPFGESCFLWYRVNDREVPTVYLHGGWGKIAAAASAQYAIDRWRPKLLINLGTCGGFAGDVEPGTILLADFTLVYDILEQMGDEDEAIGHYATELDLSWLREPPLPVRRTLLVSADRDIVAADVVMLRERFGAIAADWESGAIAWVAARNGVRCLILRGVSDVVGPDGGEAYGRPELFAARAGEIMGKLARSTRLWIAQALP